MRACRTLCTPNPPAESRAPNPTIERNSGARTFAAPVASQKEKAGLLVYPYFQAPELLILLFGEGGRGIQWVTGLLSGYPKCAPPPPSRQKVTTRAS